MAQEKQPVSKVHETVIVSSRPEDVSMWRKYAVTYYRRSITSASEETRRNNRETYEHYRALLETAGLQVQETDGTIQILSLN